MQKFLITTAILLNSILMGAQNLSGKNWTARKSGDAYIVSVSVGAKVAETLTDFATTNKLTAGQITGMGAFKKVTLRFYDINTKKFVDKTFDEFLELTNLTGNISEIEGKTSLHLHVTLGRSDYSVIAGHLMEGEIGAAGEFFFYPLQTRVVKQKDDKTGINFYDFSEE